MGDYKTETSKTNIITSQEIIMPNIKIDSKITTPIAIKILGNQITSKGHNETFQINQEIIHRLTRQISMIQ